ncbi:hypothetical protein CONPUDRAFT_50903 [Coniophora puteana RWD-64-598 SS2]|uniref:Uncharacterized protein n=1 Tax=Coniophora puteana (strain RWD-64-598) TaxID=741705 RepID=A0A5M3MZ91_CONPW|nr:uncharacterized protein CONPUDRAFT_50903 [Coniophora puteana RWD-64-598 SS2]EIW84346.1 hypothetical protein CONPUDRAFT_50903 [Coniophora puteana RWD-64-598 SS2]
MGVTHKSESASRTLWIASQSNVAVKNIAEKLIKLGFKQFKLLVSKDFHYDWHEHLYEKIEDHVIRSDRFSDDLDMISGSLGGVRVILCTLSMFANDRLGAFMRMVPVQTIIFDEASQIEVGDYLPVLHRCQRTLEKLVFIGDDKQPCFFVNVRGHEVAMGRSWVVRSFASIFRTDTRRSLTIRCQNEEEVATVVRLARFFDSKGQSYRVITPYDAQRSLIEKALENAGLSWENKCFNVDAFQGNEDNHIIVSLVRTERIGFLKNVRRTNVMLTRCKRSMVICTDRAFMSGAAQNTLPGKLAQRLGPGNWLHESDILNGHMGALASVIN